MEHKRHVRLLRLLATMAIAGCLTSCASSLATDPFGASTGPVPGLRLHGVRLSFQSSPDAKIRIMRLGDRYGGRNEITDEDRAHADRVVRQAMTSFREEVPRAFALAAARHGMSLARPGDAAPTVGFSLDQAAMACGSLGPCSFDIVMKTNVTDAAGKLAWSFTSGYRHSPDGSGGSAYVEGLLVALKRDGLTD